MKFIAQANSFEKQKADCIIIGLYENNEFTVSAQKLNKSSNGYLNDFLKKNSDFKAQVGQTFMFYDFPSPVSKHVLFVGCGPKKDLTLRDFKKILLGSTKFLSTTNVKSVLNYLIDVPVEGQTLPAKIRHATITCQDALYQFDKFKTKKEPVSTLNQIIFPIENSKSLPLCQKALEEGIAIVEGMKFTKNLANLPSNVCTPSYLVKEATQFVKAYSSLSIKTFNKKAIQKLGMGAFYSVAKGSAEDAFLIQLHYQGASKKEKPIVLVGKGVTFDTGGINLKSADGILGMKYDMCGAATVLGVLKTIAELQLPINVVGLMACTENMPSGSASKPEDIVYTLSGQTVEILNTDAEGRLILCDALTYAERFNPELVIDIATLTGAIVVALGHHATGLLSNNDDLAQEIKLAGLESHDRVWQLPLWDEYQEQLKSPFADMSNVGGKAGGSITAACFLSRFASKFPWAHLDVAGTAAMMIGSGERVATGRPVPLLAQFLINRCQS